MPTSTQKTPSTVDDYVDFFGLLAGLGIEFVVIGGCAVGAYARLLGEQVLSADLDLLVTWRSLETVVADAATIGARVQKLPQPRSVPVALLEWRGKEVNLLTGSSGLPTPDVAARAAREFHLGRGTDLAVLIADPFDLLRLLRNKLSVNRPKDQPHIAILRRFLDEEAVGGLTKEKEPRARIGAAERLLEVLGSQTLEDDLADRMVPLAAKPTDFRFLAHRAPVRLLSELMDRAPHQEIRREVERIAALRGVAL
jgi:hypothetical protein